MWTMYAVFLDGIWTGSTVILDSEVTPPPEHWVVPDPNNRYPVYGGQVSPDGYFLPPPETPTVAVVRLNAAVGALASQTLGGFGFPVDQPPLAALSELVSYADEPAVPEWQAAALALRPWRALLRQAAMARIADVLSGAVPIPTTADFLALLPAPPPPDIPV